MGDKVAKRSVHYSTAPPLTLRKCAFCAMYRRAGRGDLATAPSCTLVAGPISPSGVCDRYAPGGGALR